MKILKQTRALARLARTKRLTLGNSTYRIRGFFVNYPALRRAPNEPWLDAVYRSVLTLRPGVFVDVGANVGQTMFKVLRLDKSREYVGFEPQVACCFLIDRFIRDNLLAGSHSILPFGLSNRNGIVKLRTAGGDYDSGASMIEKFRPDNFYSTSQWVSVRRGDEVLAELSIPQISAVKIDVEGAELEVIEGLTRTVQDQKPILIFEVLNFCLISTGERLDESAMQFRTNRIGAMEANLRQHGYTIFQIQPDGQPTPVDCIRPSERAELSNTNYVAVPRAESDSFLAGVRR